MDRVLRGTEGSNPASSSSKSDANLIPEPWGYRPALRGQPVIVVQTLTESAVAIAASYAAKAFGIKTGTLMREARQLCPAVVAVQANHRLYSEYHERNLKAVDTRRRDEERPSR